MYIFLVDTFTRNVLGLGVISGTAGRGGVGLNRQPTDIATLQNYTL